MEGGMNWVYHRGKIYIEFYGKDVIDYGGVYLRRGYNLPSELLTARNAEEETKRDNRM